MRRQVKIATRFWIAHRVFLVAERIRSQNNDKYTIMEIIALSS
jgi:hypothetical protein